MAKVGISCKRYDDLPKFRKVWHATKKFHTPDFVNFMDAL
jgi:hypothetical protein